MRSFPLNLPPPPQVSQLRGASNVISNDFGLLCLRCFPPNPPPPQVSQLRRASTVISNDFDLLCLLDPQYPQNYTELFFFFRFIDKLQIKKPPPVAILPLGE